MHMVETVSCHCVEDTPFRLSNTWRTTSYQSWRLCKPVRWFNRWASVWL